MVKYFHIFTKKLYISNGLQFTYFAHGPFLEEEIRNISEHVMEFMKSCKQEYNGLQMSLAHLLLPVLVVSN